MSSNTVNVDCLCVEDVMWQLSRAEMNSQTVAPGTSGLEEEVGRGEMVGGKFAASYERNEG